MNRTNLTSPLALALFALAASLHAAQAALAGAPSGRVWPARGRFLTRTMSLI